MNARLKIKRLKRDNDLMKRIINDSEEMKRLLAAYNEPLKNVVHTTTAFKEYKVRRLLPSDSPHNGSFIGLYEKSLADEMLGEIRKHIKYQVNADCDHPCIEASVVIGQ